MPQPRDWMERLHDLRVVRQDLDELPDHERVGLLLVVWPELDSFVRAIGALAPDQREWWLRVNAKAEQTFYGGMTAMFSEQTEETNG